MSSGCLSAKPAPAKTRPDDDTIGLMFVTEDQRTLNKHRSARKLNFGIHAPETGIPPVSFLQIILSN